MNKKKEPGHVRLPNKFVWEEMRNMSGNALKILCVIKSYDPSYPSYSQLEKQAGVRREAISRGLKELVDLEFIEYEKGNCHKQSNKYKVKDLTSSKTELVRKSNWFDNRTGTSSKIEPVLVRKSNCNKTNIIKLNKKTKYICSLLPEFENLEDQLVKEKLKKCSLPVQKRWIDKMEKEGKDIPWLLEIITKAVEDASILEEGGKKVSYPLKINTYLGNAIKWDRDKPVDESKKIHDEHMERLREIYDGR